MHSRWDSEWYIKIAQTGYDFSETAQSSVNFFPFYPWLIGSLSHIIPDFKTVKNSNYILSGFIISVMSLLIVIGVLYNLFRDKWGVEVAENAILAMLTFPTSFFFTAVYTESVFLLFSVLLFYFCKRKKFVWAALTGFFAALTRPVGVLLIIPYSIELVYSRKLITKNQFYIGLCSLLFITLGLFWYMVLLTSHYGRPFAFIEAAQKWGRGKPAEITSWGNYTNLLKYLNYEYYFSESSRAHLALETLFLIFGIVFSIVLIIDRNISYGIWALVSVLFPLSNGILLSQGRYSVVVFPLFLSLAKVITGNKFLTFGYFTTSVLVLSLETILFVNGHWAG